MSDADSELVGSLPITQYLVLDTLAARWRLGEDCWTFPNRAKPALKQLEHAGWVWFQGGVVEGTVIASLTHRGMKAVLKPKYQKGRTHNDDDDDAAEQWRGTSS